MLKLFSHGLEHDRGNLKCEACRLYRHKLALNETDNLHGYPTPHSDCAHNGLFHPELIQHGLYAGICDGCGLIVLFEQRSRKGRASAISYGLADNFLGP